MVGILVTVLVICAGGAAGLLLLLADEAAKNVGVAYADPAATVAPHPNDPPLPSLAGLMPQPPSTEAGTPAIPGTSAASVEPVAAAAPSPAVAAPATEHRATRRHARRTRVAHEDGFRRARRVGGDEL